MQTTQRPMSCHRKYTWSVALLFDTNLLISRPLLTTNLHLPVAYKAFFLVFPFFSSVLGRTIGKQTALVEYRHPMSAMDKLGRNSCFLFSPPSSWFYDETILLQRSGHGGHARTRVSTQNSGGQKSVLFSHGRFFGMPRAGGQGRELATCRLYCASRRF